MKEKKKHFLHNHFRHNPDYLMNRYKHVMTFLTNKYSLLRKGYRSWDPRVQSDIQIINVVIGNRTVGPCAVDSSEHQGYKSAFPAVRGLR